MTPEHQKAFLELLQPVYKRLWRFVLIAARDRANAEDVLSETILAAYERFGTLRDKQAFVGFLFTIATRINRQRERRARWFGPFDEAAAESLHATTASPEVGAEISLLLEALDTLPAKQRETVMLFEISGFSLSEIREIQGGSLSGVKSRLVRGREQLGRALGIDSEDGRRSPDVHVVEEQRIDRNDIPNLLLLAGNE